MQHLYLRTCKTPLGNILLAGDDIGLTGLWFEGEKYFPTDLFAQEHRQDHPIFVKTERWLDTYFSGREPGELPPVHMVGTPFQLAVWEVLCHIPYGQTTTYGAIARQIAAQNGLPHMSAQAVGGAVGHNSISIIVPCHRVVGSTGSLTGYAGGIDKKIALLKLEQVNLSGLFVPRKGTAL